MTVVIDDNTYNEVKDSRSTHTLKVEYSPTGIHKYNVNIVGGHISWRDNTTEWGEKTDIKQCPKCNEFHNKNSPRLCFGCAMGLK